MNTLNSGAQTSQMHQHVLLGLAFNALEKTAGITAKATAATPSLDSFARTDATVELVANGISYQYCAEIKHVDRVSTLEQIKKHFDLSDTPSLLIAPNISAELAEKFRALGVQFLDTNGNAYLQAPGLLVFVKGQRPTHNNHLAATVLKIPRAGTATALRLIFALLCEPQLLNASYRTLSETAQVSLGTIGGIFADLENRGFTNCAKGNRRLLERERLIQEWTINFPTKLRPKLNAKRFRAPDHNWWQAVDIQRFDAQWGGEVGADKLTGYLRPAKVTIYMHPQRMRENLTALVVENKLRADHNGDVEVLEAFWDISAGDTPSNTVPPILVYADLMATMDPRNFEVAQLIYKRLIDVHAAAA